MKSSLDYSEVQFELVINDVYIFRYFCSRCLDNDRVNIHIHLCVVLFIGYILFIFGAIKSDIKVCNLRLPKLKKSSSLICGRCLH